MANLPVNLHQGDCLIVLKTMPDASVDSIVTDPPYGLSFQGKKWDHDVPSLEIWAECLRVLKPGGHLLAFSGARTYHRLDVRIEDAGFEIRDQLMWLYGSGFPKSHNVGKAMAKLGEAATDWDGLGTNLKPAHEPIVMARKPFNGSIAKNVLAHGTGALNIAACRVPFAGGADEMESKKKNQHGSRGNGARSGNVYHDMSQHGRDDYNAPGRWPANIIHDGSEAVVSEFPISSTTGKRSAKSRSAQVSNTSWLTDNHASTEYTDSGSTARFFYCAKASKNDRHEGLDSPTSSIKHGATPREIESICASRGGNNHPTVKPTQLMAYLCRLVTPPGGLVLDPFMGSGSTGKAAVIEGFQFVGIELEPEYFNISRARIQFVCNKIGINL